MFKFAHPLVHENSVDAFTPEFWAMESLMVLQEQIVMANLVYRDFEPVLARYGDTVNCRLPNDFQAIRKVNADPVTVQAASAVNVPVVLNQHVHVSFLIKDGEESLALTDLVDTYMRPAMRANANFIDKCLLATYPQFLDNMVGFSGNLTSNNARTGFLGVRASFNQRSVPDENRNLIFTVNGETAVLNTDLFLQAQQVGDDGTALREASLGRKFGLNTFKSVFAGSTINSLCSINNLFLINQASAPAGYSTGFAGTVVIDGGTGIIAVGQYVMIGSAPYRVVSHVESGGNTINLVLDRPLVNPVNNNDAISVYPVGSINSTFNYSAGWMKNVYLTLPASTTPQVGQMVSFAGPSAFTTTVTHNTPAYVIINVNTDGSVLLDRPLEAQVNNGDTVNFGPPGDYNLAFIRNAVALVCRPLAPPRAGTGALSAVANYKGLSMRATIMYDPYNQGHLVTLDLLMGVKVLDTRMGTVLLG